MTGTLSIDSGFVTSCRNSKLNRQPSTEMINLSVANSEVHAVRIVDDAVKTLNNACMRDHHIAVFGLKFCGKEIPKPALNVVIRLSLRTANPDIVIHPGGKLSLIDLIPLFHFPVSKVHLH